MSCGEAGTYLLCMSFNYILQFLIRLLLIIFNLEIENNNENEDETLRFQNLRNRYTKDMRTCLKVCVKISHSREVKRKTFLDTQ